VSRRVRFFSRAGGERELPVLNAALLIGMVALIVRSVPAEANLQRRIVSEFPSAALGYFVHEPRDGRLFNAYDFGGFIEWNAPSVKTFADGRTDIFVYNGVFDDYLRIVLLRNSLDLLRRYDIRYVLYPPGAPFAYLLDHSDRWRVLYADGVARLYERVSGAGASD